MVPFTTFNGPTHLDTGIQLGYLCMPALGAYPGCTRTQDEIGIIFELSFTILELNLIVTSKYLVEEIL